MRYKTYLNESEFHTTENWEEMKKSLDSKCKPYIKELKGVRYLLVRGVSNVNVPQYMNIKSVRTNRKPRVISYALHDELGDISLDMFGWNIRKEGLFTTKSVQDAKKWGNPIIIFPIGNFEYVWMENVYDLYSMYDSNDFHDNLYDIKSEMTEYQTSNLNKYLKTSITTTSECIIKCKKYYSINMEWYETLLKYYS